MELREHDMGPLGIWSGNRTMKKIDPSKIQLTDWPGVLQAAPDEPFNSEAARRRANTRTYTASCTCGLCAKCKQRKYRQERRAAGKK